ncbi:MAG TPA: hypothetical protein VJL29_12185 [Thermoguttaceae bacterium]|nr:hypothetical protein [Thermoguttaceae bacterium]
MFLNPVVILGYIIYFAFHAAILVGLVRIINEGDELDMQSAVSAVIISTALGMGWNFLIAYLQVPWVLTWLAYVPLVGLVGLVVALVSGIPVVRAMAVGGLYVLFLLSWVIFLVVVCGLVARLAYIHRRYAQSRRELKERIAQQQSVDKDSST